MRKTTPTVVSERNDRIDSMDQQGYTIAFEAPTLQTLKSIVAEWIRMHPNYQPCSFSHAQETRWDNTSASLAGPRHVSVYTGILLGHPTSPTIGQEAEKEPSLYEPLPV